MRVRHPDGQPLRAAVGASRVTACATVLERAARAELEATAAIAAADADGYRCRRRWLSRRNVSRTKEAQTTTTTGEPKKPKCDQVELKTSATSGSVAFMVTKASKRGRNLVGTSVTLVIPTGATVKAKACTTPAE